MKEKKKEELYNACLRTALMMWKASYFDGWRLPEGPSRGIETPRDGKDATLVVRCCRAFHARSPRDTTYNDGKHPSRLGYAFANTAALRAVRRFEVSQERAVPKYKLLAGGRNRFGNDFASGTERGNTFEESDAYKDAFLKQQNEKSTGDSAFFVKQDLNRGPPPTLLTHVSAVETQPSTHQDKNQAVSDEQIEKH